MHPLSSCSPSCWHPGILHCAHTLPSSDPSQSCLSILHLLPPSPSERRVERVIFQRKGVDERNRVGPQLEQQRPLPAAQSGCLLPGQVPVLQQVRHVAGLDLRGGGRV